MSVLFEEKWDTQSATSKCLTSLSLVAIVCPLLTLSIYLTNTLSTYSHNTLLANSHPPPLQQTPTEHCATSSVNHATTKTISSRVSPSIRDLPLRPTPCVPPNLIHVPRPVPSLISASLRVPPPHSARTANSVSNAKATATPQVSRLCCR